MRIELEKIRYAMEVRIRKEYIANVEMSWDKITDEILVMLQGFVWGNKVDEVSYPATGMDVIKSNLPEWVRKLLRLKVKYNQLVVKAVYPELLTNSKMPVYMIMQDVRVKDEA